MGRAAHVAAWQRRLQLFPAFAGGPLSAITFPDVPLRTKAWIALDADPAAEPIEWSWHEISQYVRYEQGVQITTGRPDESSTVRASSATLTLDNRDGRFTRRNPSGAYYGMLSRNTPIRLAIDPGDGDHIRFEGFVNEWPTRWARSLNDSTVPIACSGLLRRLAQGGESKSALRRTIQFSSPSAYWPLEDEGPTTSAATGVSGGRAMTVTSGEMTFTTGITGSLRALNLVADEAAYGHGEISLASTAGFQLEFVALSDQGVDTDVADIFGILDSVTGLPETVTLFVPAAFADGEGHHFAYLVEQNGADVDITPIQDGVADTPFTVTTATISNNIIVAPRIGDLASGTVLFCHATIYELTDIDDTTVRVAAVGGHAGEMAHDRMDRVCDEEDVFFTSAADTSARLGPQPAGTLMDVLRDSEAADMGVLFEDGFRLGYQARNERYNADVGMALERGDIAEPPEPADDDQRYHNQWTVMRAGGSEATYRDVAEVAANGLAPAGTTVNIEQDGQLLNQASWRVHRDTVDVDRWPRINVAFHRSPDLIPAWTSLHYGPRITVTNPPDQMNPDMVDAFVEGYVEGWDGHLWEVSLNTSPALPFNVGVYGESTPVARYDTAGSELAAQFISGTDTSMSVATTLGPIWTEDADDCPFDIRAAGVVLTVTAISGSSSPQTFTITQTPVNGVAKTLPVGTELSLADPVFYGL